MVPRAQRLTALHSNRHTCLGKDSVRRPPARFWCRSVDSGLSLAELVSRFSVKQSDPQTRGTNGTACFNPPGVRNGDSPALSVSPGPHSSRKATMNILNPFKASARRSHRVYPSSRCVSDRDALNEAALRVSQPTGESTLHYVCGWQKYNWKMSYVWKLLSKINLWCETLSI